MIWWSDEGISRSRLSYKENPAITRAKMAMGKNLGVGLVKGTSSFGRKRILILNHMDFDSIDVSKPTKKHILENNSGFCHQIWLLQALPHEILNAPNRSFLMHACAHNPTGVDPTNNGKKYLTRLSGYSKRDAKSIRIFLEDGHLLEALNHMLRTWVFMTRELAALGDFFITYLYA
ncbi:hypothetical protein L6452_18983 [Arctium lappa]|uniref:Uncharacterized protein n=1 Tax=Arctium lappa TaxID=4217 RepID=A0ACB9B7C9_ARCLA|nr:hypothetical protein L6452_18983 [Arctium lappa]